VVGVTDVVVREREPGDDPALQRLVAETVPQIAAAHDRLQTSDGPAGPSDDIVFVAEVNGHPAGFLAVRETGDALVLDRLVVAPADQGRRVGHALLDWAEGYCTSRRLRRLAVVVGGADRQALDFYHRRGYTPEGDLLVREVAHPATRA
jgi:GNAT superfamily N-acetyltransferase